MKELFFSKPYFRIRKFTPRSYVKANTLKCYLLLNKCFEQHSTPKRSFKMKYRLTKFALGNRIYEYVW